MKAMVKNQAATDGGRACMPHFHTLCWLPVPNDDSRSRIADEDEVRVDFAIFLANPSLILIESSQYRCCAGHVLLVADIYSKHLWTGILKKERGRCIRSRNRAKGLTMERPGLVRT